MRPSSKYFKILSVSLMLIMTAILLWAPQSATSTVIAQDLDAIEVANGAADVCPDGDGWTKIDLKGPGGVGEYTSNTYTYTNPDGKLVAEACYKAGDNTHTYDVEPAENPHIFTNTLFYNPPGTNLLNLSHISVRLVDPPTNATASATVISCGDDDDDDDVSPVTFTFTGVTKATVTGPENFEVTVSGTTKYNLTTGIYSVVFTVNTPTYTDPGNLNTTFEILACKSQEDDVASVLISKTCELDDLFERVTISLTGITSVTITPPVGDAFTQTTSSETYTGLMFGTYGLSDYEFEDGFVEPEGGLPESFIVEACDEKQEPTPEPTSAPTTGSPDGPIGLIMAASSAVLVSGTAFTLWFKKQQD